MSTKVFFEQKFNKEIKKTQKFDAVDTMESYIKVPPKKLLAKKLFCSIVSKIKIHSSQLGRRLMGKCLTCGEATVNVPLPSS
jgi:hypothetical protein